MTRNALGTVAIALAIFASLPAQAAGPGAQRDHHASPACDAAQLSSWFDRQRQLTDGDVDPQKPVALPAECVMAASHAAREEPGTVAADHASEHSTARPVRHAGPRG